MEVDAWVTTKKNFDRDADHTDKVPTNAPGNQVPVRMKPNPAQDAPAGSMVGSNAPTAADRDGEVIVYLQSVNQIMMEDAVVGDGDDDPGTPEIPTGGALSSGRDVVVVLGTIEGTEEDDLLPLDLIVDVTVDLGPTGDEEDTEIPRFESDATTAMTVIESSPSRTTLRAPFAIAGTGLGATGIGAYDTGVAVANMGSGSNAQPGVIKFDFYMTGAGGWL